MKSREYLIIGATLVVAAIAVWWFGFRNHAPEPPQSNHISNNTSLPAAQRSIPAPSTPASSSNQSSDSIFSNPKVKAIQAIWATQNNQAQDFYGKVVDQYGQPVVGATATGTLMWIQGVDVGEKKEQHTTQTDQNGEFQFTGFHAAQLGVVVKKEGYEMGRSPGDYKIPNEQSLGSVDDTRRDSLRQDLR